MKPLVGFFFSTLLALCSAAKLETSVHVRGHVTDGKTHEDVAGVSISAVNARHIATTDKYGFFSLELSDTVKPGDEVRIHIEARI